MTPTVTLLNKLGRNKDKSIDKARSLLTKETLFAQKRLTKFVVNQYLPNLDVSDGVIKNTNANIVKANNIGKLTSFVNNEINKTLEKLYLQSFKDIGSKSVDYFNEFNLAPKQRAAILKRNRQLVRIFVSGLFDNNQLVADVANTASKAVVSGLPYGDLKEAIEGQVNGVGGRKGAIERYHYNNGFDEIQAYSRNLDNNFSEKLSLNYAIYTGGEIKTTRSFCDSRNGKVFNREEIEDMGKLQWQGKKPNNNIFTDMGGYNCRHYWNWISYELAKRLRPDVPKSKFDKR